MSAKLAFKIVLLLLISVIGVQIMISCAFSVTDYEDKKSDSSDTQGDISSSSGNSSGGTSNPSSSTSGSSTGSNSSSSAGGSSPGSSSGSAGSNSSSSTTNNSAGSNSSSSRAGGSSSSTGGNLSSAIYKGDDFCDANPPETPDPPVFGADLDYDRATYKTVIINGQTWMAENLNHNPTTGTAKCYGHGAEDGNGRLITPAWLTGEQALENCNKYGRLYDWATARTVCPSGWRLPTRDDWNKLKDFVEDEVFQNCEDYWYDWDVATRLKSISSWKNNGNGKDYYGFNAIGGGFCVNCNSSGLTAGSGYYSGVELNYQGQSSASSASFNSSLNKSVNASWWSDTQQNATDAYAYEMTYDKQVMNEKRHNKTEYLLSVRCIKN